MMDKVYKLMIIFLFGIAGGIFADQILWPYFIERPLFYKYRLDQAPIYVNRQDQIYVQENTALQDSFEKVEKAVVAIKGVSNSGKNGSGIVITSDGLILVSNDLVPQNENQSIELYLSGERQDYKIIKRDKEKNLALIKIEKNNMPTVGFADFGSLRFGQRVFCSSALFKNNSIAKMTNEGIIKFYDDKNIETSIIDADILNGSPVFNIKGELVGVSVKDKSGKISAISINIVRDFIGF
jgi:S1-C subfamily serine protease